MGLKDGIQLCLWVPILFCIQHIQSQVWIFCDCGVGRWAVVSSCVIASALGCVVIYGDTDSIMYSIPRLNPRAVTRPTLFQIFSEYTDPGSSQTRVENGVRVRNPSLLTRVVSTFCHMYYSGETPASRREVISVIAGEPRRVGHDMHIEGYRSVVVKVINKVLSFTHLASLKMEAESTGATSLDSPQCLVFHRCVIMKPKHYICRSHNERVSKGVPYVRRDGSVVQDWATWEFSTACLRDASEDRVRLDLCVVYNHIKTSLLLRVSREQYELSVSTEGKVAKVIRLQPRSGHEPEFSSVAAADIGRVDVKYYVEVLDRCLLTFSALLGDPDTRSIRRLI